MHNSSTPIQSSRLDLIPLTPRALRLSLEGDTEAVEDLLDLDVPAEWYQERDLIQIRLKQITQNPAYKPWGLRAMVLREERQMVGHIGFHTQPGAAYLEPYALGGVEFGYTVYPPFRRRGYASEASRALMSWAHEVNGVSAFIVTISPDNTASRRLAEGLGFIKIGTHVDEEDGPEDIFRLDYPSGAAE